MNEVSYVILDFDLSIFVLLTFFSYLLDHKFTVTSVKFWTNVDNSGLKVMHRHFLLANAVSYLDFHKQNVCLLPVLDVAYQSASP